jgi:hypothetical protein
VRRPGWGLQVAIGALRAAHICTTRVFSAAAVAARRSRDFGESRLMRIENCVIFTSIRIYLPRVARLINKWQTALTSMNGSRTHIAQPSDATQQAVRKRVLGFPHPGRIPLGGDRPLKVVLRATDGQPLVDL